MIIIAVIVIMRLVVCKYPVKPASAMSAVADCNFAEQIRTHVANQCPNEFGVTFSYNKVYMGKIVNSSE